MKLSHEKRAHSYLRASMESGYTGLPEHHRHAKRQLMREHERAYPHVREHALAGADRDFDEPLHPGEREHQRHLRQQEGLTEHQVREMRDELRARLHKPQQSRVHRAAHAAARQAQTAQEGTKSARTTARRAARTVAQPIRQVTGSHRSLLRRTVGGMLLLILAYLLITGRGPKIFAGLGGLARTALGGWFNPSVDPLKRTETYLGANTPGSGSTAAGYQSEGIGVPGPHQPTLPGEVKAAANYHAGVTAPSPQAVGAHIHASENSARFLAGLRNYDRTHHIGAPSNKGAYPTHAALLAHGGA